MIADKTAYPLAWPLGYKRTQRRIDSRFKTSMDKAQRFLRDEIKRLGAKVIVISSNIPIRNDGLLYSDWMRRKIDDPGVAIYFKHQGKEKVMCCDQYRSVWENVYAIAKSIEAIRAIERYGGSQLMEKAFAGFAELPPVGHIELNCWEILEMNETKNVNQIILQYRTLSKTSHPDLGGNADKFDTLTKAYKQALAFANS